MASNNCCSGCIFSPFQAKFASILRKSKLEWKACQSAQLMKAGLINFGRTKMKIGELAQKTGLAPSRIRFYERIGLLNDKVKRSLIYTPDASRATALPDNTQDTYRQTWHLPSDDNLLTFQEFISLAAETAQGTYRQDGDRARWSSKGKVADLCLG
ncbi:MerR family DNA-binding transcriptional regulator [Shewanella algae]|nr:MerR family DNA-binding transcriptional regulator [Shewanella algae]